ncbi:hypothetical protein [Thauera butanivorans]|uniref:hypothetical protein n=1 Tax=Thauera butanivorans TaxID=86174 RepID=UPI0008397BC1|nr:hypothetical protein [Thauera butanivorans]
MRATKRPIAQPLLALLAALPDGTGARAELAERMARAPNVITTAALILRRRHLVETPARGLYRITSAGRDWLASGRQLTDRPERRRVARTTGLRERAWWVMRNARKFTVATLLDTLSDGSERDADGNLSRYLCALEKAGVVERTARRVPGAAPQSRGHVVWRLKRDLGRLAPVCRQRHGTVYDPNSGEVLPPPAEGAQ